MTFQVVVKDEPGESGRIEGKRVYLKIKKLDGFFLPKFDKSGKFPCHVTIEHITQKNFSRFDGRVFSLPCLVCAWWEKYVDQKMLLSVKFLNSIEGLVDECREDFHISTGPRYDYTGIAFVKERWSEIIHDVTTCGTYNQRSRSKRKSRKSRKLLSRRNPNFVKTKRN